jgi:hypothetical protein
MIDIMNSVDENIINSLKGNGMQNMMDDQIKALEISMCLNSFQDDPKIKKEVGLTALVLMMRKWVSELSLPNTRFDITWPIDSFWIQYNYRIDKESMKALLEILCISGSILHDLDDEDCYWTLPKPSFEE